MSSGILILPAVNRNFPRIVAQSTSGIVAYACRYHIYFVDASSKPPLVLDSKFIFKAHPGKIISLSFCKNDNPELLASIGDDRVIKIWDVESLTCLISTEVKECCRVSEWIHGSSNTLVYPSDFKSIIKWNFERGAHGITKIKTGSDINITQIVSNEKSPHLLAVGYTNGSIIVLNIVQESILHRLKIHSNEITSLSWSPVAPDILLSASLDLSLRLWKIGENQPMSSYYMPTSRYRNEDKKKIRIAGICHPKNPNAIICSNLRGDVGEIVFAESEKPKFENEKPKFSYYYQGSCDLTCKFIIAFFLVSVEDGKTNLLYCFDPFKITLWNVTEKRLTLQIPFMSQFVYDLTMSNVNPNLMAISNGEGILKVWNSQSEATKLDMVSVFVHFKTRIMTTAWHPTNENVIAYGTDEGRVGIIDIVKRKAMYSFETHHTDSVYSLSWGPCEKALKSESEKIIFYVYSCGGGVVYINRENDAKGKALNLDDLVERPSDLDSTEKSHSEIGWKLDHTRLFAGSFKGYIDIYDAELLFLMRFNVQMKTVECLRWHPEVTYMSPNGSHLKSWLACSGNDAEIHIIDTAINSEQDTSSQGAIKKLVGHNKRVVSLCWSQHKDGFLVSASKDGAALVWDILAGSIIATYLSHQDVVYAVQWSVFDQDVIYSGGQDGSVRMWKISQQTVTTVPDKAPARKKMKRPVSSTTKNSHENNSDDENADNLVIEETNKKEFNKKVFKVPGKERDAVFENFSNRKPLFPNYTIPAVVSRNENLDDCIKLADILSENHSIDRPQSFDSLKSSQSSLSIEEILKYGLFADQLTAIKMVETQGDLHKAAGDKINARYLQMMTGNIQSVLQEAAETGSLTYFLIGMAPSVSYSFWLEMCEKYAAQLVSEHSYTQACFYYLACGKIYEAIKVLSEKGNPVDALALAKARLPESDPLIPKLIWGVRKRFIGYSKLGETMCYLSANEPLAAAKTLASTNEPNYVRVATYICRKFNLDREADEYRLLCVEKCLSKYDYSTFKLLVEHEPSMQVYSALTAVHEALHCHILNLKKKDVVLNNFKEFFAVHEPGEEVYFWRGSTCKYSQQSFTAYAHQELAKELGDTEKVSLFNTLDALKVISANRMIFGTVDAHITIAIHITKFIILTLLRDVDAATLSFMKIFEASYNVAHLPKVMCSLFFPMCLSWQNNTSHIVCSNILTEEIDNSIFVLKDISTKICESITSYTKQPIEIFIMPNELQSNLHFIADKIAVLLAIKKPEDYLLAYFVSSVINDLMKIIEKKDLELICNGNFTIKGKTPVTLTGTQATTLRALETEHNLNNKNVAPQIISNVSAKTDEVDIINKLIKLGIEEAEKKEKSLIEQGIKNICEIHPSLDGTNLVSEETFVEHSCAIVRTIITNAVVESASQIGNDPTSESVVNISKNNTIQSEIVSKPFINNEKTIGDFEAFSSDCISPERISTHCEYISAKDGIIPEIDQPDNESMVLNSCNVEIPEIDQVNNENTISNIDTIPKLDQCNNENIISNAAIVREVDLSNSENAIANTTIIAEVGENVISDIVNGNVISDIAIIQDVNLSNNKNVITNTAITAEVDLSNNENVISDIAVILEVDLSNTENVISDIAIIPEVDLCNNESAISNNTIIPKVDLSEKGNVVSNNVIIPEVDLLNSKNVTSNSAISREVNLFNNENEISNSNIITEETDLPNNKDAIYDEGINSKLVQQTCHELKPSSMSENLGNEYLYLDEVTEQHIHIQCLQSIDMFYNIISFITQNICKDEFALLFYLKEKVKVLNHITASEELSKFSKEKKNEIEINVDVKKTDNELTNFQDFSKFPKLMNLPQKIEVSKIVPEDSDEKVMNPNVDSDIEIICADVIDCIVVKVSNLNLQSFENEGHQEQDGSGIDSSSSTKDAYEDQDKLNSNINQEHTYASQTECSNNSTLSHDSSNLVCDEEPVQTDVFSSNLPKEVEEIVVLSKIIDELSKAEKCHYPNPFVVIPKILRALYDVLQKSSCKFVQEKLHNLIHDIILWAERYFVGDIHFDCQVCLKTSAM